MTKSAPDDLEAVRLVVGALDAFDAKDQERILRWAREKLGLTTPALSAGAPQIGGDRLADTPAPMLGSAGRPPDIKSFVDVKSPQSDIQFAATVAYYFRFEAPEAQRKTAITSTDLQEACRQTGRSRMKNPAQTLVNAHSQGYLDRGGERGTYAVNTVGENLVAMALPEGSKPRRTPKPPRKGK